MIQRPKIHNFGGMKNGPAGGEERDYRMMQQPKDNGEGVARRGNVYEGVGASILGLHIVWACLLTSIVKKMGVRKGGLGTRCVAKSRHI